MRIILLAFTVSLAAAQTTLPVPRQASDTSASPSKKSETHTTAGQQPAALVPPVVPGKSGTGGAGHSKTGQNKTEDDQKTITVAKFPSVSIERDWTDFSTLGIRVILAFIGIAGIIVAICALRDVEEQTKAIKASVDALINSERAWVLVIDVDPPEILTAPVVNGFYFDLVNRGKSIARLVDLRYAHKFLDAKGFDAGTSRIQQTHLEAYFPRHN